MPKKINHITNTDECCAHCGIPFKYYWYDKEERNGISEIKWNDKYHKHCSEIVTGSECKSLQKLNEERKIIK
jgi:hypothetical protein